jgi:hypothetical protein
MAIRQSVEGGGLNLPLSAKPSSERVTQLRVSAALLRCLQQRWSWLACPKGRRVSSVAWGMQQQSQ